MAKNSGITKGKAHKEGGIPMTVKSTGQKIEVEGGEGIVNKYAMSSKDKFNFEGKEKTSCEIISELNQKKGDGVSFDCNTVENKKYKFKKGGMTKEEKWHLLYDFLDQRHLEGEEEAGRIMNEDGYDVTYERLYDYIDKRMVEGDEEAERLLEGMGGYAKGGLNVGTIKGFYDTMSGIVEEADEFIDKYEYRGNRGGEHPLAANVKLRDVNYNIEDALDSFQSRRGNFSRDKKDYIENELRLNQDWSYGVYNNFLDDELYFFKEYLLDRYEDILEDKQIYQTGRMGGWLVFSDGTELNTYVDELETILNANFTAEGELVGEGHWSYGHPNHDKKMTFKMFKEEGDYDDAIYYGKRIKILIAEYKEVIEDIENAKKRLPQRWKEELDQKLHEHISSDKKIKKIFNYDDPEHAKGGSLAKGGLTPEDMPDDYGESGEIVMQYLEEENIGGEDRIDIATKILDNQRPNETISETISRLGIYAKGGKTIGSGEEFTVKCSADGNKYRSPSEIEVRDRDWEKVKVEHSDGQTFAWVNKESVMKLVEKGIIQPSMIGEKDEEPDYMYYGDADNYGWERFEKELGYLPMSENYAKGGKITDSMVWNNMSYGGDGEIIEHWASDVGGSNKSVDNIINYKGKKYLVTTNFDQDMLLTPSKTATEWEDEDYAKGGKVDMNKHIWEGWTVGAFIEELEPTFDMIMNGRSWQDPFTTKEEVKRWCMDNQPYYKKYIPGVVNYFWGKVQERQKAFSYAKGGEVDKEYVLDRYYVYVNKDSWEEGQTEEVAHWDSSDYGESNQTFSSKSALMDFIKKVIERDTYEDNVEDKYFNIDKDDDDTKIDYSVLCKYVDLDRGYDHYEKASDEEIEKWKKGELELVSVGFTFAVSTYSTRVKAEFEKGGKVKKGNEMLIGGLAGFLLGMFFVK